MSRASQEHTSGGGFEAQCYKDIMLLSHKEKLRKLGDYFNEESL